MQSNFEHAIANRQYFTALVAVFKGRFHRKYHVERANVMSIPRVAQYPTSSADQNIYQDPDPPTPHWGC